MTRDIWKHLILILGALPVPFLRGHLRSAYMLALPMVGNASLCVHVDLVSGGAERARQAVDVLFDSADAVRWETVADQQDAHAIMMWPATWNRTR